MNLGTRLKQIREERGLSISELAEKAHVAKSYVWRIEKSGRSGLVNTRPSVETLQKLAEALCVSSVTLLGEQRASEPAAFHIVDLDLPLEMPASLRAYAENRRTQAEPLTDDEIWVLWGIGHTWGEPNMAEDWEFIVQSIRRAVK